MKLRIPAFLNFECQTCGGCCRDYEIALTSEEYDRLSEIDWAALYPQLAGRELFGTSSGVHSAGPYRFGFKSDGTCAFLDGEGMCLIHRRLGFDPKALSCKLFPITFAATPSGVYVGCRFNCPAVAEGAGRPLERSRTSLEKLYDEYQKSGQTSEYSEEVRFAGKKTIDWDDYLKLEKEVINTFLSPEYPLTHRVMAMWRLIDLMRQARLENVAGERFGEFVRILARGALTEVGEEIEQDGLRAPGPAPMMLFRQFLFFLLRRHGTPARWLNRRARLRKRIEGLWVDLQYSFMFGEVSIYQDEDPAPMKRVMSVAPPDLAGPGGSLIERYMAAKIFAKQIFGPLFFGYDFLRGFTSLICVFPAILWYARASALSRGGDAANDDDVLRAVEMVDYSFGYSPAPLIRSERARIKLLAHDDAPARLAHWYARHHD